MRIGIIIPALNEEARIGALVRSLASSMVGEVLVVDGGSADGTVRVAREAGARVLMAARGRGAQMRAGAMESGAGVLWFLHADTVVPEGAWVALERALQDPGVNSGTFRLEFEGSAVMTRIYGWLQRMGLTYGDASIFVRRSEYEAVGGIRPLPLFEDVDLIRRLRRRGGFVVVDASLVTSSRRFATAGAFARAWAVWIPLQLLYWMGARPEWLSRWYRAAR